MNRGSGNPVRGNAARRCWQSLALAFLAFLAGAGPAKAGEQCAQKPPPEGLVERCRSKIVFVGMPPRTYSRMRLERELVEWMRTCVVADRAWGLVEEAEESVDKVFDLVSDLPSHQASLRIIPEYTPLTFSVGGRTCYGVESVAFHVHGARGTVEEGEPEVFPGATSEMIKEAATAAKSALRDSSGGGGAAVSRFLSVLEQLERYGKDFDDTWYNVQPYSTGDPMTAGACYKDFEAGRGIVCLPDDKALEACERHLAEELVQAYHYDKVTPQRFAEILEIKAADIQRSMDHLERIQRQDSPGALPCPSIEKVFMPKIAELAGRHSVYGAGQY